MSAVSSVISFIGHNRLDFIRRSLIEGYDRTVKGGAEWVEGSLQVAAALREGRDAVPTNIAFSAWLKQNKLDFYLRHDRAALINLAFDLDLMRTILMETDSRSYQRIWGANKSRYPSHRKTHESKRKRRRDRNPGRAMIHRTMKLGEATMAKIKGSSLDSAPEMDELVILNRGAAEGELTDIVRRLVDAAAAGKDVSAIAETAKMNTVRRTSQRSLVDAWRKRMVSTWQLADDNERKALLSYLVNSLDVIQREALVEQLVDNLYAEHNKKETES